MNELEQNILDAIGTGNLTLQEIADQLGIEKSEVWQNGLNRMIGAGMIEQIRSDKISTYRVRARNSREADSFKSQISVQQRGTLYESNKDINNKLHHETCAGARENIYPRYPEDPEEVIAAAEKLDYQMSVEEAALFLASYAAVGWVNRFGQQILPEYWHKILYAWKKRQTAQQLADAKKEAKRREAGLPPVDPAELEYEYYEDAQGRKWRKRPNEDEWESVPEMITFSDGTTALKGVV